MHVTMILQKRTLIPRSQTNESFDQYPKETSGIDVITESKKERHRSHFRQWILIPLCIAILLISLMTIYYVPTPSQMNNTYSLLRELQIQWFIYTKPRRELSTECAVDQWEVKSDGDHTLHCTHKRHWDYIWFQHVRKAGGSSVCQMLKDNGIAAQQHTGDADNCQLYEWRWLRQLDTDLDGLKCM